MGGRNSQKRKRCKKSNRYPVITHEGVRNTLDIESVKNNFCKICKLFHGKKL